MGTILKQSKKKSLQPTEINHILHWLFKNKVFFFQAQLLKEEKTGVFRTTNLSLNTAASEETILSFV